jgi:predicted transcriptional regulator
VDEQERVKLRIECTLFFQRNPYTVETAQGIAMRTGRQPEHIRYILSDLVETSILEKFGDGESAIYRYVQPKFEDGIEVSCPRL